MNNETAVSMKFENKVTGITKLEKYETRLKSLKQTMETMPNAVIMDNKSVQKTDSSIQSVNNTTRSLNNNLNKTKSLMSRAFNTIGIIALGRSLRSAFSNMQSYVAASSEYVENLNLMQVAFKETGEASDRFNESFVAGLADIFGLDESTMTRQLGFYRQIGNALNIDSKYADMLSKNLLKMQLDVSSLYNLSFERAGEVLQASIAGQTKPIRGATGADITQASLQTTLDKLGIDKAISDLSRGEKVLTIYLSLVDQLSESQGDLAKTINSVANQEKIFTEQTSRLSRMIGNVFSVTLGKVLPYLNAFLMVLNELIERFAIFVGFELPTYEQQGGGYDLSDYLDDVTDSANKTKKALSGVRSFDRLNIISTPKASGVGSSIGRIDSRLLEALSDYDLKLSNIDNKATKIRDTIMEWLGFTKEVNIETGEITWKYDTLGKSAEQIAREVGTNLGNALSKETQNIKWEEYGKKLADGVNISLGFVNSFVDNYNWFSLGQGFAKGINKSLEEINWNEVGKTFTNKFKIIISTSSGFLQTLDYAELGKSIAEFINGGIENIPVSDLTKGLNALSKGILTAFIEVIKNLDWGEIGSTIGELIAGLDWESYLLIGGVVFRKKISNGLSKLLNDSLKSVTIDISSLPKSFLEYTKMSKEDGLSSGKAVSQGMKLAWQDTNKFTKSLIGVGGLLAGLNSTNNAMKDMAKNGGNVSNTLKSIGGMATSIVSSFVAFGPIGAALAAALTTVTAITTVTKEANDELKNIGETQNILSEGAENLREKLSTAEVTFTSLQKEINASVEDSITSLSYATGAVNNLENLIDVNGKIVGSTEEVQLQLDILNESLGTEYKITDGVITLNGEKIKSYDQLKKGVEKYCEKLKTEIYLEAYKEKAIESTKKIIELQEKQTYAQERLNARVKKINELQTEQNEILKKYGGNVDEIKGKDKERYEVLANQISLTTTEYRNWHDAMKKNNEEISGYQEVIDRYTEAAALNAAGKSKEAIAIITNTENEALKTAKETATTTMNDITTTVENTHPTALINVETDRKESTLKIKADTTEANKTINAWWKKVASSAIGGALGGIKLKANGGIFQNGTWSSIPKYAAGGLPPVGQLFVANEKGPELISHIGGKTYVENRNQIMDLIDSKIKNTNGVSSSQVFNIYLDPNHKLGTYTLSQLQDMASANGKPITIG